MAHATYLIVGGGMTAAAAVQGIRQLDRQGQILVLSAEPYLPYKRPMLSKGLWKGAALEDIWISCGDENTEWLVRTRALELDVTAHAVRASDGQTYTYDKLLLATGGSPRKPWGEGVIYFRTLDDYHKLRMHAAPNARVVVIGGGFIGAEIAAALAMKGVRVTMVFPEHGIGARIFPPGLAEFLNTYYRQKGVAILAGDPVRYVEQRNARWCVQTESGTEFDAELVVAGVGIEPNVELARQAGLPVENGIAVDMHLRAGDTDVFAAGDVANFFCPALGERIRVEHEDNAIAQGTMAGRNMAGAHEQYDYVPMFYSDLFELGYEAVGILDSRLELVEDWQEPYTQGVVYYCRDGYIKGVLLWNVWERVEHARRLIAAGKQYQTLDAIKGLIPL
ncbi:MAG: FAD/NAD(P)-binding oxidoreductase [Bacteroidota bacterium]|nr:FAD/NAD(P)-binding oxidoreductase [Bacteroidota bacterium]